MSKMAPRWELAYGSALIDWNGKTLVFNPDKVREELEFNHRMGLRWVNPCGIQYVEKSECDIDAAARQFKAWADELGIRVSSHHCTFPTFAPLEDSQEPLQALLRKTVDSCSIISPNSLVVHPGSQYNRPNYGPELFTTFQEQVDRHGLDAIIETAARNLKGMARHAAEYGMNIALENTGRFEPLGDWDTIFMLVEAVDEPNCGYCLDAGHVHAFGGSVVDWVYRTGSRLFETHFHDNRARGSMLYPPTGFVQCFDSGSADEHLPVGFGTINWLDVIKALDEIGFPGPVTFECGGWPNYDDYAEGLHQAIAWWRTCEYMALKR